MHFQKCQLICGGGCWNLVSQALNVEETQCVSYPFEFQWSFQYCYPRKYQRFQLHFFVSEFELVSQAYPREPLAHIRAAPIAGSVHELGWQPWWGRFKALLIWWSTRIWRADALIFCLHNVWLYHRVAQRKGSQKCLAKEKRKTLLVAWSPLAELRETCGFAFQLCISDHYFYCSSSAIVNKTEIACKI